MNTLDEIKAKMQEALDHLQKELSQLRSGRANPGMLDSVPIEVYGTQMRIRELANVTTPEPRQILVTPFDPQTAGPIGKSIEKANIGMQPILEGNVIRINIPPMDESMRKDIAKQAKKKAEDAKVGVREVRRKGNDLVRKQKADGDIAEDEMKKAEKRIQELTDEFCKQVDVLFVEKEKEVMTV
ncbi:MAG: ribosome recycling factor [Simkaniaceae bacterium]|nr:ribosome recycling factor [Candidatus Sacchlamyda saccharinae]